jgi:phospholipase C
VNRFLTLAALALLVACKHAGPSPSPTPSPAPTIGSTPITHVVIVIQENRSFDNLFYGFPGANTALSGKNAAGQQVTLQPVSLTAPYDLSHRHAAFVTEYAGGAMNGFSNEAGGGCTSCPPRSTWAYGYVPPAETAPYFALAKAYTLADDMFQTNQGPSFPAHQYLISGTSTVSNGSALRVSGNPNNTNGVGKSSGGCDSIPGTQVETIDQAGNPGGKVFPCFTRLALTDEINTSPYTWRYYQAKTGAGLWNAPDAVKPTWGSPQFKSDVIAPSAQVLTDVANGTLANVTWVTPTALASDHAGATDGSGPDWVTSVVDAIGQSKYWSSTAIFVTWDDWGGWYDHVKPPVYNSYELGFRVPLIVISPYAKNGYVSHAQHEFGSILKFTEETFGLPSMNTTDARADDLSDCFNYAQTPTAFNTFPTVHARAYYLAQQAADPDDDR